MKLGLFDKEILVKGQLEVDLDFGGNPMGGDPVDEVHVTGNNSPDGIQFEDDYTVLFTLLNKHQKSLDDYNKRFGSDLNHDSEVPSRDEIRVKAAIVSNRERGNDNLEIDVCLNGEVWHHTVNLADVINGKSKVFIFS